MRGSKLLFVGFCVLSIWMLIFQVVHAQTMEDYTDIYTLGEIVVSGEREGVEAVGTVREITAEDIQNKGARTLDEALQLLPGVFIRTGADGVPRVDLRGFRSRHVILLLDGIPLNSTFDGNFDPTVIPVENIDMIKVSYGSHSVLYGDGGLGGVINIVTKRGKKDEFMVWCWVRRETGAIISDSSTCSGGYGKADFFLSGSHFERDGFRLSHDFKATTLEDGGTRDNSDKRGITFLPMSIMLSLIRYLLELFSIILKGNTVYLRPQLILRMIFLKSRDLKELIILRVTLDTFH